MKKAQLTSCLSRWSCLVHGRPLEAARHPAGGVAHLLDHEVGAGGREVSDASVGPSGAFLRVNASFANDEDRIPLSFCLGEHELEVRR